MWFICMEHFNYAFHPKDFFLPKGCFATRNRVVWIVRHRAYGEGHEHLEQYAVSDGLFLFLKISITNVLSHTEYDEHRGPE